jgi:ssDNA-binding Zn-finger/Zn-ribbon topoisomerase 1
MINPYPRKYICDNCGYQQVFTKNAHKRLRRMFCPNEELRIEKKDLPLFFECHMCHDGMMKPKNYSGPEGFIIPTLD